MNGKRGLGANVAVRPGSVSCGHLLFPALLLRAQMGGPADLKIEC